MPSDLPIVTPDPPPSSRRSVAERYGGLFYLGVGGLVVVVALVSWFAREVYRMRGVWGAVYVLHDGSRPEDERIRAAHALAREPHVSARQLWDIALRRDLPPLARYLVAEALPAEAATAAPRGFALAVARSPGWPDWLRVLLARPMAYAALSGTRFPPEALAEARAKWPDPFLHAWLLAAQARAEMTTNTASPPAFPDLDTLRKTHPGVAVPALLLQSELRPPEDAVKLLDRATRALRSEHPGAAVLWNGWEERDGELVRTSAPILPRSAEAATGTRVPAPTSPADGRPLRSPTDVTPPRPAPDNPRAALAP